MEIDPWASTQFQDYARLREEFGIESFPSDDLPEPHHLFRRGVVFGGRGYAQVLNAIRGSEPFAIMTGLMPSGNMHLGHKMLIDQVIYYQGLGAKIYVAVADIESFGARNIPFDVAEKVAMEQYVTNYIALGLKDKDCQIYFQSKRKAVTDLAHRLGKRVNLSMMRAIYGFDESTNMCHVFAPLVQVGDILHPQLDQYEGPIPVLVPVGVDQDPHIRLTRDVAAAHRLFNILYTKDQKVGIFVKVDENVDELIEAAQQTMETLGYADFEAIPSYKALYLPGATQGDLPKIDAALTGLEKERGGYGFFSPGSSYHRFMTGLDGGKMSSSRPESCIFLCDPPDVAKKKVMRCKTGGRTTAEEQKKLGGSPEDCVVYELYVYHLEKDDNKLSQIAQECKSGSVLCGECKVRAAGLVTTMLEDIQDEQEEASKRIPDYFSDE